MNATSLEQTIRLKPSYRSLFGNSEEKSTAISYLEVMQKVLNSLKNVTKLSILVGYPMAEESTHPRRSEEAPWMSLLSAFFSKQQTVLFAPERKITHS